MVASRAGASRAASVFSSGTARDRLKRRDKPYKTEQQKILAKKRRLAIHTSYLTQAPKGYTFLAVGTPDLAELCKELSRQRDLPVNVVSATPTSAKAVDPDKLSHHVHRIGYHFNNTVLEDACEQLGYIAYKNRYVKPIDLQKQQSDSHLGQILSKHGMHYQGSSQRESPEQVRAAIKELFPRIPLHDLTEIVRHAWEKGTNRVGNVAELDLGRRVQLAVIARIRHQYTDYDQLLRAFGWAEARKEVEPVTLRKLIEWRGENEEEDNELEEIVRETIVIDDDEEGEAVNSAIGIEDEDLTDVGDISDTSVEISHRPAAAHDLRAEEANEREHRYLQRWQPVRRTEAERTGIARAKINAVRNQALTNQPGTVYVQKSTAPPMWTGHSPHAVYSGRQDTTRGFTGNGTVLQRVPPDAQTIQPQRHYHLSNADHASHSPSTQTWPPHQVPHTHPRPSYANAADARPLYERAFPSIEHDGSPRQLLTTYDRVGNADAGVSAHHSRPSTPDSIRARKQQRYPTVTMQSSPVHRAFLDAPSDTHKVQHPELPGWRGETLDWISPSQAEAGWLAPRSQVVRVVSSIDGRYRPIYTDGSGYHSGTDPPLRVGATDRMIPRENHRLIEKSQTGYTPEQPRPGERDQGGYRVFDSARYPEPTQPGQQLVYPERLPDWNGYYRDQQQQVPLDYTRPAVRDQRAPTGVHNVKIVGTVGQKRIPPAPVHGAPAPVQQMAREAPYPAQALAASDYHYPPYPGFENGNLNAQVYTGGSALPPAEPVYPR